MRLHGRIALVVAGLLLASCSLLDKRTRPDKAVENVYCALEYQPSAADSGPDLLFLAWSSPYRMERFYMSLPDNLLHMAFAPGRHLTMDARVEGATCTARPWRKRFRLPASPSEKRWLLCQRHGDEAVLFEVETKWGTCTRTLPQGDRTPRNDLDRIRTVRELPELGAPRPDFR